MFKLSGAVFIMGAAILTGMRMNYSLNERKRILSELLYFLQAIEGKLRCMCMPLDCCFNESGSVFYEASVYIKNGESPSSAIRKATEEMQYLKKEDKELLYNFSGGLTAEDCDGQIANVQLLSKGLTMNLDEATKEAKLRGRLSVQGCTLLGAAAVILML